MPAQRNREEAYQQDSETKLFMNYLSITTPLDRSTIRTLPAVYRTAITRNQIGLLSGRLVYYEHVFLLTNTSVVLSFLYRFVAKQ